MIAIERTSYQLSRVALLALCAGTACADEPGPPMFSFSGFGTLGAVHSSEKNADFTSSTFKPNGAGFSRNWSADVDSLIAAQVIANPTQKVSAVLQVVAEQNYDNSYRPHVEWANLKYQFTPDFSVRIGRTLLPILMMADSHKIGYSNPWVRPPSEVYSLVPVTSNDGVDISYRMPIGSGTNTLQVTAGQSDTRFPAGNGTFGTVKVRELAALANTFEQGFATVRVNVGRARITIAQLDPLFDAFRKFGPEGIAIADRYDVNNRRVSFLGMGANYDPGRWFAMGEWYRVVSDAVIGRKSGWYVSSGYRFGAFTPYLTYGQSKADNLSDPGLNVSGFPPGLAEPASGLNAALNSILSTKPVQKTISIGGRWDVIKNAAVKLQFDRTRIGAGSTGVLSNTQPGFQPGGTVNLFSATMDFVF
jgi:Gram-negative porin